MKKVLLASTALVAFAGAAAAEIALSGSAEMGVIGGNTSIDITGGGDLDVSTPLQFSQNVDVTFSMSGETDGGLAFGVSVDLDENGIDGPETDDHGVAVFISGNFGTVTMGDTDGAMDRVLTEAGNIGNPGTIDDSETTHDGYNGDYLDGSGDGQIVRYDYTFDSFQIAVSVEQEPSGPNGLVVENDDGLTWAIGFGYDFEFGGGSVDLGLAYQQSDSGNLNGIIGGVGGFETSAFGFSAVVNLESGLSAGLVYTNYDFSGTGAPDENLTHIAIGAGYAFDGISLHANYGQYRFDDTTVSGLGLAAAYDLGGGASVNFGYGLSQSDDLNFGGDGRADDYSRSSYSLGLSFSF